MRIIPAIDIIEGKCVRLSQGDYNTKKIYNENPLELAKEMEDSGIKHLHLVDLDGAKAKHIINHKVLETICNATNLLVDFGGGLKSDTDVRIAFESGANQITAGSIAAQNPDLLEKWIEKYGSFKIILGADSRNRKIATNGWKKIGDLEIIPFVENYLSKGIKYVIPTDINKDGMLAGPAFELYKELLQLQNINLIASGGVSSIEDLINLKSIGCEGAIVGKAIYEGYITLTEIQKLC